MDNDEEVKHFWEFVEQNLGNCKVPKYLKNILYLTGHDNIASIKNITSEDIKQIEIYARSGMTTLIPETANRRDYFHIYNAKPELFQIPIGHRRLLQIIVEQMNSEDFQTAYFKVREVEKRQARAVRSDTTGAPLGQHEKIVPGNHVLSKSDLEEERKNIFKKITNWLQKNCAYILEKYANEVNLDMVILNMEQNVDTNVSELVKDIICPVCKKLIKIVETKTVLAGGTDNFHFLISNFTRHVQTIHIMKQMSSSMSASRVAILKTPLTLEGFTPYIIKEVSLVSPVEPAEDTVKIITLGNPDYDDNNDNTNLDLQYDLEFTNQEETEEFILLEQQETNPQEVDANEARFTSSNRAFNEMLQVKHNGEVKIPEIEDVATSEYGDVNTSKDVNVDTSKDENVGTSKDDNVDTLKDKNVDISKDDNVDTSKDENVDTSKVENVITSEVDANEAGSKRVVVDILQEEHDAATNCPKIEIRKRKYRRQTTNSKNDERKILRKNQK